ncbi:MAG: polysaccharide biosynthesis/export family protein [Gemmatimonadaceae bacterium]
MRTTLRTILSWFLLVTCSAGVTSAFAQKPLVYATPEVEQTLNPGDKIQITVFRMPELSGEFVIATDGTINQPLYHAVTVTGIPLAEAKDRIRAVLLRLQSNPEFVIQPLFRVAVGGEVRQPNLFNLSPETTIAQAVAVAGGVTEQGRLDQVKLLRGGGESTLDLTQPGSVLSQMHVHSGDQIIVTRRTSTFRDVIIPLGSVVAGLAGVISLLLHH